MRTIALALGLSLALAATGASAHIPSSGKTAATASDDSSKAGGSERFLAGSTAPEVRAVASFGPFRVIDARRAALVAQTDAASPGSFRAMLAAWPQIRTIELVECPGTVDDIANLELGRMIRARGLDTHVPANGSVRSGGVELYFAGVHRRAEAGAEFAVHSWRDDTGKEWRDVPANDPVNRTYIAYYREMGLTPERAVAFYKLTNSVPNDSALWLNAGDIAKFDSAR